MSVFVQLMPNALPPGRAKLAMRLAPGSACNARQSRTADRHCMAVAAAMAATVQCVPLAPTSTCRAAMQLNSSRDKCEDRTAIVVDASRVVAIQHIAIALSGISLCQRAARTPPSVPALSASPAVERNKRCRRSRTTLRIVLLSTDSKRAMSAAAPLSPGSAPRHACPAPASDATS